MKRIIKHIGIGMATLAVVVGAVVGLPAGIGYVISAVFRLSKNFPFTYWGFGVFAIAGLALSGFALYFAFYSIPKAIIHED